MSQGMPHTQLKMKNKLHIIIALFAVLCISFSAEAQKIESMKGAFWPNTDEELPMDISFEYNAEGLISRVAASIIVNDEQSQSFHEGDLEIPPGPLELYYYAYEYNEDGQISKFEARVGNIDNFGTSNYWKLAEKYDYTYTPEGWILSKTSYRVCNDGSPCPDDRYEYTYDAAGNEIACYKSDYDEEASEGNEWCPSFKREILIDSEDNTKWTESYQDYNTFKGDWDAPSYTYYTMLFNDKGLIKEKSEYEDEERLILKYTEKYVYNDEGKPILIEFIDNARSNYSKQTIQYPAYGMPELLHSEFMGEDSSYNRFTTSYEGADCTTIKSKGGYNTVFSDFDAKGYPTLVGVLYTDEDREDAIVIADFTITYATPSGNAPAVTIDSSIRAENGALVVEAAKASFLLVYDASGRVFVKKHIPAGASRHSLPGGTYIVVVDNISRKIQL